MNDSGLSAGAETRARILEVAIELFLAQGYHATSMQQISDRLEITKAALYYHFSSKSDIVGRLVEPLSEDIERALDLAENLDDRREIRAVVLEGYLDVVLRYRDSLLMLTRDVSAGTQGFYERLINLTERASELISGPDASLEDRVRAMQAFTAITDPIVMFPDVPNEELRGILLEGAWRLLD